MTNNQPLIPTPVVNKNGVATTVYKKPQEAASGTRGIPAPVSSPVVSKDEQLARMIINYLMPNLSRRSSKEVQQFERERATALNTLMSFPEELRDGILALLEDDDADETHHTNLVYSLTERMPQSFFNEYVAYNRFITRDCYILILNGLRQYGQLPKVDDYSKVPGYSREQIAALLNIAEALVDESSYRRSANRKVPNYRHGLPIFRGTGETRINHSKDFAYVYGDDLVQLILDHPDKAEQIKGIIIDRSTGDADLIRDIIMTSAPAISEGTL